MYERPDYTTARKTAGFSWRVSVGVYAYQQLAGVTLQDYFLNPEACITAYKEGRRRAKELFGDDVQYVGPSTPNISYGHPNGLGAKLNFPEGGEVAVSPLYGSLDEAIEALQAPVDYATAGMAPFYREFYRKMCAAFPSETVGFGYSLEGPITTAYEVRGDAFFTDPFDQPEKTREFLRLLTRSIMEFHAFRCSVTGQEVVNSTGSGMCDDIASMIPPHMWKDFVIPYWEQYYNGMTTGKRRAHVEDLRPAQLEYLEAVGLCRYDPSISPKINPKVITGNCLVPFDWRLGSFHYTSMDCGDVEDFVWQSVADGASGVFTVVERTLCSSESAMEKVRAFIRAAKRASAMLDSGASREDVGALVSPRGKEKFWAHWPY